MLKLNGYGLLSSAVFGLCICAFVGKLAAEDKVGSPQRQVVVQDSDYSPTMCFDFSPDGMLFATGGGPILVRDAKTYQVIQQLMAADLPFGATGYQIVFSPDSKHVATSGGKLVIWNVFTGVAERTIEPKEQSLSTELTYSPDGKLLAVCLTSDEIAIWEAATGREVSIVPKRDSGVFDIQFDPKGETLTACYRDSLVAVWDVVKGRRQSSFKLSDKKLRAATFSADRKRLAVATEDQIMSQWDLATQSQVASYNRNTWKGFDAIAYHPDGKTLCVVCGNSDGISWDGVVSKRLWTVGAPFYPAKLQRGVKYHPDGSQVALVSANLDECNVCNADTGKRELLIGCKADLHGEIAFSGVKQIATSNRRDHVSVWDFGKTKPDALEGERLPSCNTDGQLITVRDESTIILWDDGTKQKIRAWDSPNPVNLLSVSPNGKLIATASSRKAGPIDVWDATTGNRVSSFPGHKDRTRALTFSADNSLVASVGMSQEIVLWNAQTGKIVKRLGDATYSKFLAMSPDGKRLAIQDDFKAISLWNVNSGEKIETLDFTDKGDVQDTRFDKDGQNLIVASGKEVFVYDLLKKTTVTKIKYEEETSPSRISTDGTLVATVSAWGTKLEVREINSGKTLGSLVTFESGKDWLVFTPDGAFDGSDLGRKRMTFRLGTEQAVHPSEEFEKELYRPGLLSHLLDRRN